MNPTNLPTRMILLKLKLLGLAAILCAALATSAHATITVQDEYLMGEADGGVASGDTVTNSVDSVGSNNLNVVNGDVTYSSDVPTGIGSTLSVDVGSVANGLASSATPTFPSGGNGVGLEGWFEITGATNGDNNGNTNQPLIYLGNGGSNGFGLFTISGDWGAVIGGEGLYSTGTAITTNTWVYLAAVIQNDTLTFYLNGTTPATTINLSHDPADPTAGFAMNFNGNADDVEYFTFTPGEFTASTDLSINNPPTVPEPTTMAELFAGTLALGGLLSYRRKTRA